MNTRALVRGISGKSLLAFAGIVLLLGVVTGEAAAATVKGTVTKNGVGVANLFVVATTHVTFLAEAQTDAGGNYTIVLPNMPGGTQFFVFVDLTGTRLVSALDDTIEKTLTFTGADLGPVTFKLVDGVKLSGTVTNTITNPDSPASGVIVFAINPIRGKFLGEVTTGGDGTYGLLVPPDETAELAVDTQGKFPGTVVDPVFLDVVIPKQPTPDIAGLNFFLIPGVTVQGHVTNVLGDPISNALVEAFFVDPDPTVPWTWLGDDTTGLNGFYSIAVALELKQIRLRVTAAGFVERRVDVTLVSPMPDVNIVLGTSVQISGRVTDASTKLGVASVPVEADFGDLILDVGLTGNGVNAPLGSYTLDVPPNQGFVTIHVDTTNFPYLQPGDGEVVVGTVDFPGIDFALTPSVSISGKVTDATGMPVPGAGVTAFQGAIAVAFDLTDSLTDPDPGKYLLKVAKAAVGQSYTVDIHVDAGTSFQTADRFGVTVGTSDILNVDFALKLAVQNDTVTIQTAVWSKNQLNIAATNLVAGAKLFASVVDSNGNLILDSKGIAVLNDVQMTFKNGQYQIGKKTTVNLCKIGAFAKVRSDKGTTPATKQFCK